MNIGPLWDTDLFHSMPLSVVPWIFGGGYFALMQPTPEQTLMVVVGAVVICYMWFRTLIRIEKLRRAKEGKG